MLNKIWPIIIIVSVIYSIVSGNLDKLNDSIVNSSKKAVDLSINLLGMICLWNGIMNIAIKTSIVDKIVRILKPFIDMLFPDLKKNKKIKKEIAMNMVANILGVGNAATPLGLKAMKSLQKINKNKDRLSDSMMMLIVINTASIQLIPTTIIAIRSGLESRNPTSIIVPVWIATFFSALSGIIATKILIKKG